MSSPTEQGDDLSGPNVFSLDTVDIRNEPPIPTTPDVPTAYHVKANILNDALKDIGMGKYQWCLFVVAGFGWLSDSLWPIVTGLILTPVVYEFNGRAPYLKLAQNIGLLVGGAFWGAVSDVWGRRWPFNLTLLISGVFATVAGASPDYVTLCLLVAILSIGVGGNLPVDSAVFLEFVPASHHYLLTTLSIWSALGQLLGSLVCEHSISKSLGHSYPNFRALVPQSLVPPLRTKILRFLVFIRYESPKYLMGHGEDNAAVKIIHKVAVFNGKTSSLTVERLESRGTLAMESPESEAVMHESAMGGIRRGLARFDLSHVKPLFATRDLARSTTLLIVLWVLIGFAFPLYNGFLIYFLQTKGADFGDSSVYITYRNQFILSAIGVPSALVAGYSVESPFLGRRRTLAIFTFLTGVFMLVSTTARTSNALLGWNCAYSFTSNGMYAVLYAVSSELFPTKDRGTGNAIVTSANRVSGIIASVIVLYINLNTPVPVYIAGVILLCAGLIVLLLPLDPRGNPSL